MAYAATGTPFDERGGRLRGAIDVAAGRYPGFVFGLGLRRVLPVFHFHETTVDALDPAFQYLVENGYRTIVSDDIAQFVRHGRSPGDHCVMLAFDDAWASLWTVVKPLLDRYDLRAVAYAIPGRIVDAPSTRPTSVDAHADHHVDRGETPFVTWPELRALATSGRVDVQSHTWSHSMIFTDDRVVGAVDAAFVREPRLNRPRLSTGLPFEFLEPDRVGFPLFQRRSRMSDARRFFPDLDACARAEALATETHASGSAVARVSGRWETPDEQVAAIEQELAAGREQLEARLGQPVRHVCLPWGVSGALTRSALERLGIETAFANRWRGRFAVAAGDDPYFLKRLHSRHIFTLPGRGRRPVTLWT